MKNYTILSLILLILVGACEPNKVQHNNKELITFSKEDSAFLNYVGRTFGYDSIQSIKKLSFYYNLENERGPSKETIIYPGQYKLREYILTDGQSYPCFGIKITNKNDSIVGYFSFADEVSYLYNSNKARWYEFEDKIEFLDRKVNDSNSILLKNLEFNLNELIRKLNYQNNKEAIYILLDAILNDQLSMSYVHDYELKGLIKDLKRLNKRNKLESTITEYTEALDIDNDTFRFRAKRGQYGYWLIKIEKDNNGYVVKPKFIGDLLFFEWFW